MKSNRAKREWWNHNQASSSRAGPSYMETPTTIQDDQTRMLDNWAQDSENLAQQWKDFAETCKAAKAPCQKPTPVRRSPNRDPRKKEQIKPKGVKEIDDLNIKAEGLYKQIQHMPKITTEVIFVPAYEPKKSPSGARIQVALYEEANRRIDEVFPSHQQQQVVCHGIQRMGILEAQVHLRIPTLLTGRRVPWLQLPLPQAQRTVAQRPPSSSVRTLRAQGGTM